MIILEMCRPINFFERWGHVQALHVSNDQPMLPIFRNFVSSRGFGVKDHSQNLPRVTSLKWKKTTFQLWMVFKGHMEGPIVAIFEYTQLKW